MVFPEHDFNPIIVLFLTHKECTGSLRDNFNPIIVLFLTDHKYDLSANIVFQSYYSLISNFFCFKGLCSSNTISILL